MASIPEFTVPPQIATPSPNRRSRGSGFREGRRGPRGGLQEGLADLPQTKSARGGRRGGQGGQGESFGANTNQQTRRATNLVPSPDPPIPPPPGLGGGGSFGDRPIEDARNPMGGGEVKAQEGMEEDVEVEVCFICASPVVHNSVAPCNHRTCHICTLRLRALYKTRACAHCRVSSHPCSMTRSANMLSSHTVRSKVRNIYR